MKKIWAFLSVISLLVAIGCKSNPTAKNDATATDHKLVNPNTKTVGNANYTVDIPKSWTSGIKQRGDIPIFNMASSPDAADSNIYMNILTEAMRGYNLEDYRTATIKSIVDGMPGITMKDKGDIDASNLKGKWFTYTTKDAEDEMDGINYSFQKKDTAYIISGTTDAGQMNKLRNELDSIAKSLQVQD